MPDQQDKTQQTIPDFGVQDRALQTVKESRIKAMHFMDPYYTKFRTYYEMYRGFQSNKHYEGRANLFVPMAFENVEDTNARVLKAYNGIRTRPGSGATTLDSAKKSKLVLDYQSKLYKYKNVFADLRQDASIYGTGVLKIGWIYNPAKKKDHPVIKAVDPADYLFDPDGTSRDDLRYEIFREWQTLHNLEKNPNYFNLERLKKSGDTKKTQGAEGRSGDSADTLKDSRYAAIGVNHPKNSGKVEVFEYWGLFAEEEGGEEEEYLIVTGNDIVIRCEKNPYKDIFAEGVVDETMYRPFITLKDTDVAHQFLGVGMVEPILRLLEELNDNRNQRMDNVTLIVDQMYYVLDDAEIDEDDLIARGGGVVYGSVTGGVTPLPRGDVTASAYQEESLIKEDIQRALGLSPLAKGAIEGLSGEAMHTVLSILESGNVRIDQKTSRFADAVSQTFQIILAFDQAFIDDPIEIDDEDAEETIEGTLEFPKISKADIAGQIKVEVEMDTQMSRIIRRAEADRVFDKLQGNPLINQEVLMKNYLESIDRAGVIDELMDVPPPAPPTSEPPRISVTLNSKDLNGLQIGDLLLASGLVKPESSDPLLNDDLRALMNGDDPAKQDRDLKTASLREKLLEEERLTKRESADSILKAKELELKEREIALREGEGGGQTQQPTEQNTSLGSRIASIFKSK